MRSKRAIQNRVSQIDFVAAFSEAFWPNSYPSVVYDTRLRHSSLRFGGWIYYKVGDISEHISGGCLLQNIYVIASKFTQHVRAFSKHVRDRDYRFSGLAFASKFQLGRGISARVIALLPPPPSDGPLCGTSRLVTQVATLSE